MSGPNQGWNPDGTPRAEANVPDMGQQPAYSGPPQDYLGPPPIQDQPPMPPPPYGAPNQPQYGDQPGYADPNQPHYGGPAQPNFPPPAPPPSKRGQWLRIGVIVLLAVVVGGGFYFFRDRLSSSASDLAVGDCIDEPAGTTDISEVQHQPCNEPHDGEVFAVITHTAPSGATYPLSTEFRDLVSDECLPAMETYAGSSYLDMYANGYDVSFLYPTSASWTDGDRGVTCFIVKSDETKMTGSLRVGAATPLP